MERKSSETSRRERAHAAARGRAAAGEGRERSRRHRATAYEPPAFEVICLACEVSAYAPDEDAPLL